MRDKLRPLETYALETQLTKAGMGYTEHGFVNPGVYHCSTVLYPSVEALHARTQPYLYGRGGSPTHRAFEEGVTAIEGGEATLICPSGLSAITTALLTFVSAGDHILMPDPVYRPARHFCDTVLARMGVQTSYYDPLIGGDIAGLIRPETRIVYTEQPGSQSLEVQDLPAIAAAAQAQNVLVMLDNTWATGRFFNGFKHGADIVVTAATKYFGGHSDVMLGTITSRKSHFKALDDTHHAFGIAVGPDDVYLGLRGLRTLDVRLERHMKSGLAVARWLQARPEVERVLYPALPEDPGHALWKRDFTGASGLFSVILKPVSDAAVAAMLDGLSLFGMGYSWGGYESLVVPFDPRSYRSATRWDAGPALRFHIGLEAVDDLVADLTDGFARMARA
ncbi:cystathionine beta-lyase [Rhodoligotrophos appendicifer]|uniref:cystathionine beta-lyase n=1 Tax=Rhodoligotrophos appendicifer TaxID=987056 RepID=UPI001185108A|nr:cystathionine beta-lyase [Rhodoligotrophos appendicifer]